MPEAADESAPTRAARALDQACRALQIPVPQLSMPSTGSRAQARQDSAGRPTIVMPVPYVEARDAAALLGAMAHEAAHLQAGDHSSLQLRGVGGFSDPLVLVLVVMTPVLAAEIGAGWVAFSHPELQQWWPITALAIAISGVLALRAWVMGEDRRRLGVDRRIVELRADLAAARGVGREPVLAFLASLPADRSLTAWMSGTHPSRALREESVLADVDQTRDVTVAAIDLWRHRSRPGSSRPRRLRSSRRRRMS